MNKTYAKQRSFNCSLPVVWTIFVFLIAAVVLAQVVILARFVAKTDYGSDKQIHLLRRFGHYRLENERKAFAMIKRNKTTKAARANPGDRAPTVVNPFPYHAVIVPPKPSDELFLLVCVHSAPEHVHKRQFVRRSWGNVTQYSKPVKLVFFLGLIEDEIKPSDDILEEHAQYEDIIVYDFVDSYWNLTIKSMAELQYVSSHCQNSTFILKTDDDALVNGFELVKFLATFHTSEAFLLGEVMVTPQISDLNEVPQRMLMPVNQKPEGNYIQFLSGLGYIFTPDTALALYRRALITRYFWIGDVFITGIVRQKVGIDIIYFNSAYLPDLNHFLKACDNEKCRKSWIFAHASGQSVTTAMKLWKHLASLYEK